MPKKTKILVLCSRNKKRSLTAEHIYRNDPLIQVTSAGTSDIARKKVNATDIRSADLVLCMEKKHKDFILSKFPLANNKKVIVLDIEDNYEYMDSELVEILRGFIDGFKSNLAG